MRQRYTFTEKGMVPTRDGIWVKDIPLIIQGSSNGLAFYDLNNVIVAQIASAPKWKLHEGCKAVLEREGYETDFADWSTEGAFWGLK